MNRKPMGIFPYQGNKEKLIEKIYPYFPKDRTRLIDAFCGACSVSLYSDGVIVSNDMNSDLIGLYTALIDIDNPVDEIISICKQHNLDKHNQDAYLEFRDKYNKNKDPLWLYCLISHSFSNMYRVNSKNDFNVNFGKREFSKNEIARLNLFKEETNTGRITFENKHYKQLEIKAGDFVYIDPPYLITGASYNNNWSFVDEMGLYEWIEQLDQRGIKFGLSNVTHNKNKVNQYLLNFIERGNFTVISLEDVVYKLGRSDWANKDTNKTQEVYITNC